MVVFGNHLADAVAKPDVLGALRTGGQKHLRRGRVGVFLQEVVLHLPREVDAEAVCHLDLLQSVIEELLFIALAPRPGQLVFVENAEFHGRKGVRAKRTPSQPIREADFKGSFAAGVLTREAVERRMIAARW